MRKFLSKTFLSAIFGIFLLLAFSGCIYVDFTSQRTIIMGTGDLVRYDIPLGEFDQIRIGGYFELHYHNEPSLANRAVLEIQSNLREYIQIEIVNGELQISTERGANINPTLTPVINIYNPSIKGLIITGAVDFRSHDIIKADNFYLNISGAGNGNAVLDVNSLELIVSGAGNFNLSGKTGDINLRMSGAGNVDAMELESRTGSVNFSGAGTVRVNSTEMLDIRANGVGTVVYRGSPRLTINNSGMVSIRSID